MAVLSAALPYIAAASTVLGVASTIKQGNEQKNQMELLAREREEDARRWYDEEEGA